MPGAQTDTVNKMMAGSGVKKSVCFELFTVIGTLREAPRDEIREYFLRAFAEDPTAALRIAFYARDVRGGLGERRVFREILRVLAETDADALAKNIDYVPLCGRWDDLLCLFGTQGETAAVECIRRQLGRDLVSLAANDGVVSLLAKWMPSANTSSRKKRWCGRRLAKALGMREEEYRKMLTVLRSRIYIVENDMREKRRDLDYESLPYHARVKYQSAFWRRDGSKYLAFCRAAYRGEANIRRGTIYPYDCYEIVRHAAEYGENMEGKGRAALEAMWRAIPDHTGGKNMLVAVGSSAVRYWPYKHPRPNAVAISLALYFAERNRGIFRDRFLTFKMEPQLVKIKGDDFYARMRYCYAFTEVKRVDVAAAFRLVLDEAAAHHVPPDEMPRMICFVSGMEFACCTENAKPEDIENIEKMYAEMGYEMPEAVFWDVYAIRPTITKNESGSTIITGSNPTLFMQMMKGDTDPMSYMQALLESERYRGIEA